MPVEVYAVELYCVFCRMPSTYNVVYLFQLDCLPQCISPTLFSILSSTSKCRHRRRRPRPSEARASPPDSDPPKRATRR
eukprot:6662878-Pyramimonas_sp.AAC.1